MALTNVIKEVRKEIERLTEVLRLLTGTRKSAPHRKMTALGRKRISAAQKKRWAKIKRAGEK